MSERDPRDHSWDTFLGLGYLYSNLQRAECGLAPIMEAAMQSDLRLCSRENLGAIREDLRRALATLNGILDGGTVTPGE